MVSNSFGYFRHNVCKALECVDHQNKSIKRCQSKVIFCMNRRGNMQHVQATKYALLKRSMFEEYRSAGLKRTSPMALKLHSFKHEKVARIPYVPYGLLCHYGR